MKSKRLSDIAQSPRLRVRSIRIEFRFCLSSFVDTVISSYLPCLPERYTLTFLQVQTIWPLNVFLAWMLWIIPSALVAYA